LKEIEWDRDDAVQRFDESDMNGTRVELDQISYKVDTFDQKLKQHDYDYLQSTIEVNKQIDSVIRQMIDVTQGNPLQL